PIIFLKPGFLLTRSFPFLNLVKNFLPAKSFFLHISNLKFNLLQETSRVYLS
ncbi:unnamed protein product, partial [Linum tenue]